HADLAGSVKWLTTDCRETLERASARETASRTAAGAVAKCLLGAVGIEVLGFVRQIHRIATDVVVTPETRDRIRAARDASETYCPDEQASDAQCAIIRQAKIDKDTVGGIVEAHVFGCPPGLGSSMDWTTKLDARIAYAVMGIQAFKAVEIGLGRECAERFGSEVHDPIEFDVRRIEEASLGFVRPTNNAGGTEGGMTNGQPVVVKGTMKPISTLLRGLPSIDLNTKEAEHSQYERSDVCAVSAASVVMENVVAFEVARCLLDKFAGDTMHEVRDAWSSFLERARALPDPERLAGG
ncbi:MAG: chorismate synthase, partial [Phycisphaerales bacterium]|nr:chorismate synthase [Phycisphaerales bacterium]